MENTLVKIIKPMSTIFKKNMVAWYQESSNNDFILTSIDGKYSQKFCFIYKNYIIKCNSIFSFFVKMLRKEQLN
jgi:hypothetical protein